MVWAIWARFATSIRPRPCAPAELDATAQPVVGADHPAAHVFGVAEAAQGRRLAARARRAPRELEAAAVLAQAALDVAAREAEVAAQVVDARSLGERGPAGRGRRLGALQVGEAPSRSSVTRLTAASPIQARQRSASLSAAASAPRRPRAPRHVARSCRMSPCEAGEREAVGALGRELRPRSTSRSAVS